MTGARILIVAGYQEVDLAERELQALAAKVGANEVRSDGMILVGKDADGDPRLADTGNHLGLDLGSVFLRSHATPPARNDGGVRPTVQLWL
jgi:hypothetical protein